MVGVVAVAVGPQDCLGLRRWRVGGPCSMESVGPCCGAVVRYEQVVVEDFPRFLSMVCLLVVLVVPEQCPSNEAWM